MNPQVEQEEEPTPLPQAVDELLNNQATSEETLEALRGVVDIDDDNDPAPETFQHPLTSLHLLFLGNGVMKVFALESNKATKTFVQIKCCT